MLLWFRLLVKIVATIAPVAGLVSCDSPTGNDSTNESDTEDAIEDPGFTGVTWRAVWAQSLEHPDDPWQKLADDRLCVAERLPGDPLTGAPETRVLLDGPGHYIRPFFSQDGQTVYYTTPRNSAAPEPPTYETRAIDWDGSNDRAVAEGFACDSYYDPVTGEEWILAGTEIGGVEAVIFAQRLVRYPAAAPDNKNDVWNATLTSMVNPEISIDGAVISSTFPWPKGGVAQAGSERWRRTTDGCWPSLLPGHRDIGWVFDGRHRNAQLWMEGQPDPRLIRINGGPGILGYEIYHPRWSNHPNFFTCTGPYREGEGGMRIGHGGSGVEVYIGKFDPSLTDVVAWERVTTNAIADFAPDVWIGDAAGAFVDRNEIANAYGDDREESRADEIEIGEIWPGTEEDLLLIWADNQSTNDVILPDGTHRTFQFVPKKHARFGRHFELETGGGHFVLEDDVAEFLAGEIGRRHEFTLEILITPEEKSSATLSTIISLSDGNGGHNLTLSQDGSAFHLRVRTMRTRVGAEKSGLHFGKIFVDEPTHLLVSYREGEIRTYVNGVEEKSRRGIYSNLGNWTPQRLIIGDSWEGGNDWKGLIEGLALFGRAVGHDEAIDHFGLAMRRLEGRPPINTQRLRGRLKVAPERPSLQGLGAYKRHLSAYVYTIIEGELRGQDVIVYHWTVLDREYVPGFPREIGQDYDLVLQQKETHPQLQSESSDAPDDFTLVEYLDISTP